MCLCMCEVAGGTDCHSIVKTVHNVEETVAKLLEVLKTGDLWSPTTKTYCMSTVLLHPGSTTSDAIAACCPCCCSIKASRKTTVEALIVACNTTRTAPYCVCGIGHAPVVVIKDLSATALQYCYQLFCRARQSDTIRRSRCSIGVSMYGSQSSRR